MAGKSCYYLDTSAFAKLVRAEPETPAMRAYLARDQQSVLVSAMLLRTETLRAMARVDQRYVAQARRLLRREIAMIPLDRDLLDQAALLQPVGLRTLDAIHVAAALALGDDLSEVVTYDGRLAEAARQQGLVVASPT